MAQEGLIFERFKDSRQMKECVRTADERDGEMSLRPMSKWKLVKTLNTVQCDPIWRLDQYCMREFFLSAKM